MKTLRPMIPNILLSVFIVLLSPLFILFLPGAAKAYDGPPAPTNLKAELTEDTPYPKIHLTWVGPDAYKYYIVAQNRSTTARSNFEVSHVNSATIYVGGMEGIYDIYVQYRIIPDDNISDLASTSIDFSRPSKAPAYLLVSDIKWYGAATLSWIDYNSQESNWIIDITGNNEEGYSVSRRIELPPQDGMVSTLITSPLKSEGSYTFEVRAVNGGFKGPKESVSALIPMMPLSGLTAVYKSDNPPLVELRWTKNTYHHDDAIQIIRTNPDGTETLINNTYYDGYWPDDQVEKNKTYTYRVRAINNSQPGYNSPTSDPITITTIQWSFPTNEPVVKPIDRLLPHLPEPPGLERVPALLGDSRRRVLLCRGTPAHLGRAVRAVPLELPLLLPHVPGHEHPDQAGDRPHEKSQPGIKKVRLTPSPNVLVAQYPPHIQPPKHPSPSSQRCVLHLRTAAEH